MSQVQTPLINRAVCGLLGALVRGPAIITSTYGSLLVSFAILKTVEKVAKIAVSFLLKALNIEIKEKSNYVSSIEENIYFNTKNTSIFSLLYMGIGCGITGAVGLKIADIAFGKMPNIYRVIAGGFGFDFVQEDRFKHIQNLISENHLFK